jgi:hypothetical protein
MVPPDMLYGYRGAISGTVAELVCPNLLTNVTKDIAGPFEKPAKEAASGFQNVGSKVLCSCRMEDMMHQFPLRTPVTVFMSTFRHADLSNFTIASLARPYLSIVQLGDPIPRLTIRYHW